MENPYWIVDSAIIFKPEFNDSLDKYTYIISNCRKLIFSNYNDPHMCLKNNNIYNYYDITSKVSLFNQPLDNSLSNLHNLRELTLSFKFNHSLCDSLSNLSNLRELTFGYFFNQPLDDSLSNLVNLRELILSEYFNQSLDNSLSNLVNLRKLSLGRYFNQPIVIPGWITKLTIGCNSQQVIDYLPFNIVELEFGYNFDLELNDLPSSIKKIKIRNPYYNKKLNNLPSRIESLEISTICRVKIDAKYKNLLIVKI